MAAGFTKRCTLIGQKEEFNFTTKLGIRNLCKNEDRMVGFPGGAVVKSSASSAGGVGSVPDQGAKIAIYFLAKKPKT